MQGKDQLEQNINQSKRDYSTACGPNLLQDAATARMNQIDQQNERNGSFPMGPVDMTAYMQDMNTRQDFNDHFRLPGGMTFRRGSILADDK